MPASSSCLLETHPQNWYTHELACHFSRACLPESSSCSSRSIRGAKLQDCWEELSACVPLKPPAQLHDKINHQHWRLINVMGLKRRMNFLSLGFPSKSVRLHVVDLKIVFWCLVLHILSAQQRVRTSDQLQRPQRMDKCVCIN